MAVFLQTHWESFRNFQSTTKEFESRLQSAWDADKRLMKSCTKLGNEGRRDGFASLVELYATMKRHFVEGTRDYKTDLDNALAGNSPAVKQFQRMRLDHGLKCCGLFKLYFVCKTLQSEFPTMEIQTVVGSNLSAKRKSGAFHKLFQRLASRLPSDAEHALLEHVFASVTALIQDTHPVLEARLTVDDMEHSLCEWVKACRNRDLLADQTISKNARLSIAHPNNVVDPKAQLFDSFFASEHP
jgi:hypothetical protein